VIADVVGLLGYSLADAWNLTPRELRTLRKAIRVKRQYDANLVLWQIWGQRMKDPPRSIAALLGEEDTDSKPIHVSQERLMEIFARYQEQQREQANGN